jgi:putative hydrolase of the HAD superfamily
VSGPRTRIEAVLFDLGGTLVDEREFAGWAELARGIYLDLTPEDLAHAYAEVEEELDAAPLRLAPEASAVEFWRRVLARASGQELAAASAQRFVDARRGWELGHPHALYSDVRRCLDQLTGERRRLGIVSNSTSESSVRGILDRAGIVGYFERVVSSGTEGVAKPEPEIFRRAVERFGVPAPAALYVGNLRRTDALAAREAGLNSVWLHRDGTGLGDDPPEITSLLEVPLVVRQLEEPRAPSPGVK